MDDNRGSRLSRLFHALQDIAKLGPTVHDHAMSPPAATPADIARPTGWRPSPAPEPGDREAAVLWGWACVAIANADDDLVEACRRQGVHQDRLDHRAVRVPVLQPPRDGREQRHIDEKVKRRREHGDEDIEWQDVAPRVAGSGATPRWMILTLRHIAVGLQALADADHLDTRLLLKDLDRIERHLNRADRHLNVAYGRKRRRPRECADESCDALPKGAARYCDRCRKHKSRWGITPQDCKWCRTGRPHPRKGKR